MVKNNFAQKDSKAWLVGGSLYAYDINSNDEQISRARSLGYCDGIDLTTEVSKVSLYSSNFGPRSKVRENVIETNVSLQIILRDTQPENVAMALFGSSSVVSEAVSKVEMQPAFLNGLVILDGFIDDVNSVQVTDEAGTTVYLVDENFVINNGSIYILEDQISATNPIVDGQIVKITYDTIKTTVIEGFEDSSKLVGLYFEGENLAESGELVKVEIYKVSLDPTDNYSILSGEDYVTLTINATVLASNKAKGTSKYYRETRQA